jgi:DNA modification methylase
MSLLMYYASMNAVGQMFLFDVEPSANSSTSTTFINNMKLPIHRWFRYSAGFSAEWVKCIIKKYAKTNSMILDPFAGSGTTLVAANESNIPSIGYEKHYFVNRLANTKLHYSINFDYLNKLYSEVINYHQSDSFDFESQPDLLKRCYTPEVLKNLTILKNNFLRIADNTLESEILWLAITAILRSSSFAGTAQWQYILPNKKKKNVLEPKDALNRKLNEIIYDIQLFNNRNIGSLANMLDHDARDVLVNYENAFDILITSPPYPNNYDYADSTRLEMIFWGEITGWSDLQSKVRSSLIRSCSQHSAAEKIILENILENPLLAPILDELTKVCRNLEQVRLEHGGKKTYHTMIAAYYFDLAKVFIALRSVMREGSIVCFVIGDSAPYGIYAPADLWLGKLAVAAGFKSWVFEKTRDRNIKWKNRKHSVPLKEGRLWIKG